MFFSQQAFSATRWTSSPCNWTMRRLTICTTWTTTKSVDSCSTNAQQSPDERETCLNNGLVLYRQDCNIDVFWYRHCFSNYFQLSLSNVYFLYCHLFHRCVRVFFNELWIFNERDIIVWILSSFKSFCWVVINFIKR